MGPMNATPQQAPAMPVAIQQASKEPAPIVRAGFDSAPGFEALQRMGRMLSTSALVPDTFRGDQNIGSCCIAIELATRLGISPIAVTQHLNIIHGRPAWSAQFYISAINTCGRFAALKYRFTGTRGTDSWGCIAHTTELATGEKIEGTEITLGMAKSEGWYEKKGSKWVSMPEQMLRYRAAAFLVRSVAPELTMGILTRDEAEEEHTRETVDITPPTVPLITGIEEGKRVSIKPAPAPTPSPVTVAEPPAPKPPDAKPEQPEFPTKPKAARAGRTSDRDALIGGFGKATTLDQYNATCASLDAIVERNGLDHEERAAVEEAKRAALGRIEAGM